MEKKRFEKPVAVPIKKRFAFTVFLKLCFKTPKCIEFISMRLKDGSYPGELMTGCLFITTHNVQTCFIYREYTILVKSKQWSIINAAVKSNQCSIINAAFRLVELLLGYILQPTSSEKRGLFGGQKGLKSSFNQLKDFHSRYFRLTSWILLKQLFLSPSWPLSQQPIRLLTQSPFELVE